MNLNLFNDDYCEPQQVTLRCYGIHCGAKVELTTIKPDEVLVVSPYGTLKVEDSWNLCWEYKLPVEFPVPIYIPKTAMVMKMCIMDMGSSKVLTIKVKDTMVNWEDDVPPSTIKQLPYAFWKLVFQGGQTEGQLEAKLIKKEWLIYHK